MPYTGPERRPTRARWHDYREPRTYFITIVAQHRMCRFGGIHDGVMHLSAAGKMVVDVWASLSERHPQIISEAMVLMPNHLHAIVRVGAAEDEDQRPLPRAIGWIKSVTTTRYARNVRDRGWPPFERQLWQRSFHDRIVRSSEEQATFLSYIEQNPRLWREDTFHEPETGEPVGVQILPVPEVPEQHQR